jgi:hypothetical protein
MIKITGLIIKMNSIIRYSLIYKRNLKIADPQNYMTSQIPYVDPLPLISVPQRTANHKCTVRDDLAGRKGGSNTVYRELNPARRHLNGVVRSVLQYHFYQQCRHV